MMMISNIETYSFTSSDQFLIDTNFWIINYFPLSPTNQRVNIYSNAFSKMLHAKCTLYIDVLILSEFINRISRVRHGIIAPKVDYKVFRKSNNFQEVALEISECVKRILDCCHIVDHEFNKIDTTTLLKEYSSGTVDFNDQVLAETCKNKNLKLVTDDSDFKKQGITIITGNRKLLNKSILTNK